MSRRREEDVTVTDIARDGRTTGISIYFLDEDMWFVEFVVGFKRGMENTEA